MKFNINNCEISLSVNADNKIVFQMGDFVLNLDTKEARNLARNFYRFNKAHAAAYAYINFLANRIDDSTDKCTVLENSSGTQIRIFSNTTKQIQIKTKDSDWENWDKDAQIDFYKSNGWTQISPTAECLVEECYIKDKSFGYIIKVLRNSSCKNKAVNAVPWNGFKWDFSSEIIVVLDDTWKLCSEPEPISLSKGNK